MIAHPGYPIGARPAFNVTRTLLLVLVAAAAAGGFVAAIAGLGVTTHAGPAFEATNGPHVEVSALPGVELDRILGLPGLSEASGPFPLVSTSVRHDGKEAGLRLEGRPAGATVVDHPVVGAGTWIRPRTIVLERDFARRFGVSPGDRVTVAGASGPLRLLVSGVAATTAGKASGDALGWALPETLRAVAPNNRMHGSTVVLRLSDPDRAAAYTRWIRDFYAGQGVVVHTR